MKFRECGFRFLLAIYHNNGYVMWTCIKVWNTRRLAVCLVGTKEDERIQVKADNSDNSPWFEGHGEIK